MTLYSRRDKISGLSAALGRIFGPLPFSPNAWTLFTFVPALIGFWSAYQGQFLTAFALFLVTAFVDVIDGAVARYQNKATKKGAYLDAVTDRYVEFIIIASLLFLALPTFLFSSVYWIALLLFGSLISSFVKAASVEKGLHAGKGGHGVKGGILEHTDRVVLLVVCFLAYNVINTLYVTYLVALMAVLSNISAIQRFNGAYKN